ncbi:MAG: hypothetical protein CVU40_04795 [Chloroflexi bacterium HGW-Chloroflexi-2]|nr:MAG: hypothetical protein CVU40_04795 [Chloroflexi bacterium HGW-Chloroflexi-2]
MAENSVVVSETNQPEQVQIRIENEVVSPPQTETIPLPITQLQELAVTYNRLDGNRLVAGEGGLSSFPVEVALAGTPEWIVGIALEDKVVIHVVLIDGRVQAFELDSNLVIQEITANISALHPGNPPVLASDGNIAFLIKPPDDISPFTHPVLQENGSLVYIDDKGDLIWTTAGTTLQFKVNALPDARILMDELGRLLFLSNPTSDYPHGVLGDALEARSITLIDPNSIPVSIKEFQIDPVDVIEGIAPLWVDLDGDGVREIIVTQSNIHVGARIVVYNQEGEVIAQSDPIGLGFRWLHLIAAAQIVNGDTLDLVVVRTPHIGGVLEIYELTEGKLEISNSLKGYSSHQIGSRNLDASLVTDMNADGIPDIVVPDQSQQYLSALQITDAEWTEIWRVPMNGKLSTNLMGLYSPKSGLVLGAGTEGNKLMLWVLKD